MPMSLQELSDESGISQEVIQGMRLLESKKSDDALVLSPEEKSAVQDMLVSLIGDMDTNKKIITISPYSRMDSGIGGMTAAEVKDISYRTRNLHKIQPEMDRIWNNFQDALNGERELATNEKMTLKEFGMLYDLANLNAILEQYNTLGLIEGNDRLEALYQTTQRAATMVRHLDNTFDQQFRAPVGSVVFDRTKSKSEIYGKELSAFEKGVTKVTKFGHASRAVTVENNDQVSNKLSHINPGYKEEKFALRNFLYADVYRIKLENLISEEDQALFKEHLGDDWLQQLEQEFSDIEQEIHNGARDMHEHVTAEGGTGRFASVATNKLHGGYKNFVKKDHKNPEVRDDVMGKGQWDVENRDQSKVLCSEFVGKTLIAAVQELNDRVVKRLRDDGVDNVPDRMISSPISQREKLKLMTPERLLHALEERHVIEKVESPRELSQFIHKHGDARTTGVTRDFKEKLHAEIDEDVDHEIESGLQFDEDDSGMKLS
ncbi:hypothetical protein BN59_01254 [Legionella massiliensis]|uniref:Uncharacterized protein n=1 Tax=Legionella massiliensis TaxID=1034943 RepID=A0A078KRE0_9GAMM|nr:hypothetical protein [Legionella massiliensis]CDZ76975.1 hypothetical protein BN59_01254 [Legionella massiliensis]CEE12713.1 hypothetical protein BN1094_01254 [Legionella massiliensis]